MNTPITIVNDVATTTSIKVADVFEKQHKNVLRDIERIQSTLKRLGRRGLNFERTNYLDRQGKERPMYRMDKDAFAMLALGFNGDKAIGFQADFLAAFNQMELEIMKMKTKLIDPTDVPAALELLAARLREEAFTALPETKPAIPVDPARKMTITQTPRNMETASVRHTLPLLGFKPHNTTAWLVDAGYLEVKTVPWNKAGLKVPTEKGKKFFEKPHNSALYINPTGQQHMLDLEDKRENPCKVHSIKED